MSDQDIKIMVEKRLRSIGIIITTTVALIALLSSLIYPFVWKSSVDAELRSHQIEIDRLKRSEEIREKLLFEIRYNLRSLCERQGIPYIENPVIK